MCRIYIIVEGQTEESFVKNVLIPHLKNKSGKQSIVVQPIIIQTKREKSGNKFKGGVSKYKKIRDEIYRISDQNCIITTMFDYYGLPDDFPGKNNITSFTDIYDKIDELHVAWEKDISKQNFLPFILLHEFETFIFADPIKAADSLLDPGKSGEMEKIVSAYDNIEMINDGPDTHPSARIEKIFPEYNKVQDGTIITQKIGINEIRSKCQNFDHWINRLLKEIHEPIPGIEGR